jgi:hypothetical protein
LDCFLNGTGIGLNVIQTQPFGNVPTNWTVPGPAISWRRLRRHGLALHHDRCELHRRRRDGVAHERHHASSWPIVGIGHFNNPVVLPSRNSDILWRNSKGDLAIWFMNGISIIPNVPQGVGNVPTDWSVVGTGDSGDSMAAGSTTSSGAAPTMGPTAPSAMWRSG